MADTVKSMSVTKGGLISIQVGSGYPVTASAPKWVALMKESHTIGKFINDNKAAIVARARAAAAQKAAENEAAINALVGDEGEGDEAEATS